MSCCGRSGAFNTQTEGCCSSNVKYKLGEGVCCSEVRAVFYNLSSMSPSRRSEMGCCGKTLINTSFHSCCSGIGFLAPYPHATKHCCYGQTYRTQKAPSSSSSSTRKVLIQSTAVAPRVSPDGNQKVCCGWASIDPKKQFCCGDAVYSIADATFEGFYSASTLMSATLTLTASVVLLVLFVGL